MTMTPSILDRQVSSLLRPATAGAETPVAELATHLEKIASIAIVDERGAPIGIVSRTDLVAITAGWRSAARPARCAADIMTSGVVTIPTTSSIRSAARAMAAHAIHHVYVTDGARLAGVIDAIDIVAAVRDAGAVAPLSSIMTATPIMVSLGTELGAAVDLLSRVRVSGLVVVYEGMPIGTFTHVDAIAARALPRRTPIDDIYEPAVLCLPAATPLHVVARQLVQLGTSRVIACASREVVGIATTLDFVRYVAW